MVRLHRLVRTGVELVVARHLLDDLARCPVVLEDDEMPQQVEKPLAARRRRAQHFQLQAWLAGRSSSPSMVRQGMNHS